MRPFFSAFRRRQSGLTPRRASGRSRGRLKLGVRAGAEALAARLRERMREQVVRDSPFNAAQMRNFFEVFEDNYKRERDMV